MVQGEAEVAKLKPEAFEVTKCLSTDIDIDLFSKTIISVMGDKHHGHPVIAGITRNLFRAPAIYNIHNFFDSCRTVKGQADACRVRQKIDMVYLEKKEDATVHLRVLRTRFRPRSILSRNYKNQ